MVIYLLALPLTAGPALPPPFESIRWPELFFIPMLIFLIWNKQVFDFSFLSIQTIGPAALVLLTGFLQAIVRGSPDGAIELLKTGYLLTAGLSLAVFFRQPGGAALALTVLYRGAAWYALAGLAGYALAALAPAWFGHWVWYYADFPLLGDVQRLRFLTDTPTMLGLFLALVWLIGRYTPGLRPPGWMQLALLAALALTFSKTVLLLLAVGLWKSTPGEQWARLRRVAAIGLIVFEMFATHWALVPTDQLALSHSAKQLGERVEASWSGYALVGTTYSELKRAAVRAGLEHPGLGLGWGRFPQYQVRLQEQGLFPAHIPDYAPHATGWSAFAEGGWPGLAALLLWFGSIAWLLARTDSPYAALLRVAFLLLALESLHTDLLNVRVLWVFLALLWAGKAVSLRA